MANTKYDLIVDVRPTVITSAYVVAPFDKAKAKLERSGYHVISLEENARLRMQEGRDSDVSKNGNWVREGVLYVPNEGKFLTRNSPIMDNPVKATNAHRKGKDFYLTDNQVEEALSDSVALSLKSIPTDRFGEDEITSYAFGEIAKQYGGFLKEAGIDSMPIYTADLQDKPFARQLWFRGVGGRSGLYGYCGYLGDVSVRGVLDAEGAKKSLERKTK